MYDCGKNYSVLKKKSSVSERLKVLPKIVQQICSRPII